MDKDKNFTSIVLSENKKVSTNSGKIKKVKNLQIGELITPEKLQVLNIVDTYCVSSKTFFNKVVYNDRTSFFLKDWEANSEDFQKSATRDHIFMVKKVFNGIRVFDICGNTKYVANIDTQNELFINEHFGGQRLKNFYIRLR